MTCGAFPCLSFLILFLYILYRPPLCIHVYNRKTVAIKELLHDVYFMRPLLVATPVSGRSRRRHLPITPGQGKNPRYHISLSSDRALDVRKIVQADSLPKCTLSLAVNGEGEEVVSMLRRSRLAVMDPDRG